jgi:hypothetical protein
MHRIRAVLFAAAALGGCQLIQPSPDTPPTAATPAPRACDLAGFGAAPGIELGKPKAADQARDKSEPLRHADRYVLNRSAADTGTWSDAGSGWKSWRYWVRSETARSVSLHVEPLSLPPQAELWLCSPDRTTRQGPITGKGYGDVGQYWSPDVPGPELWVEVLVPAGAEKAAKFVLSEAFAAPR